MKKFQMKKKGQVAFEFLLIYSFFIFVFLSSLYIISSQAIQQQRYAEGIYAREFISVFVDEINTAAMIEGYEKEVYIPSTINSESFQLYIYKGMIGLNFTSFTNIDILYPLATDKVFVNGVDTSQAKGEINVKKGKLKIFNSGGQVIINEQ